MLKINCHSPGSIQRSAGADTNITTVNITPTIMAGRNCSRADCIISRAYPECTRRARITVSRADRVTATAAVATQIPRNDAASRAAAFSQNSCAPATARARMPLAAIAAELGAARHLGSNRAYFGQYLVQIAQARSPVRLGINRPQGYS